METLELVNKHIEAENTINTINDQLIEALSEFVDELFQYTHDDEELCALVYDAELSEELEVVTAFKNNSQTITVDGILRDFDEPNKTEVVFEIDDNFNYKEYHSFPVQALLTHSSERETLIKSLLSEITTLRKENVTHD